VASTVVRDWRSTTLPRLREQMEQTKKDSFHHPVPPVGNIIKVVHCTLLCWHINEQFACVSVFCPCRCLRRLDDRLQRKPKPSGNKISLLDSASKMVLFSQRLLFVTRSTWNGNSFDKALGTQHPHGRLTCLVLALHQLGQHKGLRFSTTH
jgi:hypothetical protein